MDGRRKGFLTALVVGVLAAPALALGATQVFGASPAGAAPAATAVVPALGITPAAATTEAAAPDFAVACGPEAAALVAGEDAGTLSDIQQAALDALRPICASAGFRVEEASWAGVDGGGAEVTAAAGIAPAGSIGQGTAHHEDEYEDDEYEDDEYEDEDHGTGLQHEDDTEGHEVEVDD